MQKIIASFIAAAALAAPLSVTAQGVPGAADASRVAAGTYKVDTNHTQVFWTVNHMGITPLTGAFPASGGTLQLDPAKPAAAKLNVTFNVADTSTTVMHLTQHMLTAEMFDAAKFPTASFTSTAVQANGTRARITGNLTIKGITKPVTLDAQFNGAGTNPMSKKLNIGFTATARVKRSDFGLGYAAPVVSDDVDLHITGAFEQVG